MGKINLLSFTFNQITESASLTTAELYVHIYVHTYIHRLWKWCVAHIYSVCMSVLASASLLCLLKYQTLAHKLLQICT